MTAKKPRKNYTGKAPAVTVLPSSAGLCAVPEQSKRNSAARRRETTAAAKILTGGSLLGISFERKADK